MSNESFHFFFHHFLLSFLADRKKGIIFMARNIYLLLCRKTAIVIGLYSHQLHNSLLTKLAFSFSIQYSVLALTTVLPKQRWIFSLYWARFPISCTQTYLVYVYVTSASVLLLVSKYLTGMLFSKRPFTILREFAKGQMGVSNPSRVTGSVIGERRYN